MIRLSCLTSSCSPFSLSDVGARYPNCVQTGDLEKTEIQYECYSQNFIKQQCDLRSLTINLCPRVITMFFVSSCINHMDNVIYGDGGLSNISGEHNLSLAHFRALEYSLLVSH